MSTGAAAVEAASSGGRKKVGMKASTPRRPLYGAHQGGLKSEARARDAVSNTAARINVLHPMGAGCVGSDRL